MNTNKTLADKIQKKIKSGQLKMKTKSYFILRTLLSVLAIVLILLASVFLLSFVLFILRINGIWLMPGLGIRGLMTFFVSLPWFLIIVGLLFLLALEFFVKKYTFAYRKPVLYSVVALILFVGLSSILIDRTSLHSGWMQKAGNNELPLMGNMYRGYRQMREHDAYVGVIKNIDQNSFELVDKDEQVLFVNITNQTRIFKRQVLQEGDLVMVMGELDNNKIEAFGIHKVEEDFRINYHPMFRHF